MTLNIREQSKTIIAALLFAASWSFAAAAQEGNPQSAEELRKEIRQLQEQMAEQQRAFEKRIARLERRVEETTSEESSDSAEDANLEALLAKERESERDAASSTAERPVSSTKSAFQSMNPDISVIVDGFYHKDDSSKGIQHIFEEIAGFGHSHEGDHDHGHEHSHLEDGFNLRHLELHLAAEVDPYFRGWAIGAISEEGAELEEAVLQTTALPWGLQLQGGKFFSNFSRINAQHAHEWDFVDAPLVHQLLFGDHGLNEKGFQLSWLAPTPFQMLLGMEALQGENELAFDHHGDGPFSDESGPRLWIGWLKLAPDLRDPHGLQIGLAGGRGVHQEEHDALDNDEWFNNGNVVSVSDGEPDHWMDGDTTFFSADLVYKYDDTRPYGIGDWTAEAGYLWREKDLELVDHILPAAPLGNDRVDTQDGYYAQALYGFAPRWRTGLRWEQIGLANRSVSPTGNRESYDDSQRASLMLDYSPSEFSRLRLQVARGEYETEDGGEDVWQFFLQWTVSLGTHGAHSF
ncbi:MAG: zinc-regulated TonB-dependent outer membrane receptor [Verrucomicrobiota bacterium]